MTAILNSLVTVLGAWLVVSPYLLGTRGVALAIAIAAGAIALVLSIVAIKQEAYKPTLDYVLCALGIALALWGIVGWIAGLGAGLSEIIVGALVAALSFGATRFAHTYAGASFYDRGGRSEPAHERRYHPHEGFAVAVDAVDGLYQARGGLESSHDGSLRLD